MFDIGRDSFNRADGPLGTADLGGAWAHVNASTGGVVATNRCGTTNTGMAVALPVAQKQVRVQGTVSGFYARITALVGDAPFRYLALLYDNASPTLALAYHWPDGSFGIRASAPATAGQNVLAIEVDGLEVRCYENGVLRITHTLTQAEFDYLGDRAGIRLADATAWVDDWSASIFANATDMPAVSVRFARTAAPFAVPDALDWVTLSDNPVRNLSTRAGRARPLDRVPPTELSIVLDNRNGNLDPRNPASPYTPDVVPGRHIEVTITPVDGAPAVLFRGYVDRWQPRYSKGQAWCEVTARDALAYLATYRLGASLHEDLILASSPRDYVPMATGEVRSGFFDRLYTPNVVRTGDLDGLSATVSMDTADLSPFDRRGSVRYSGSTVAGGSSDIGGFPNVAPWSAEFVFSADLAPANSDLLNGTGWRVEFASGKAVARFVRASDETTFSTPLSGTLATGVPHLVTVTYDASNVGRLYVNGALVGSASVGGALKAQPLAGMFVGGTSTRPYTGRIGRLAGWSTVRSLAHHQAHWDAVSAPWDEDANSDDRFSHALAYVGWPAALTSAGAGNAAVEPFAPEGAYLLDYLHHLEDTEGGYVAVAPAGVVTFVPDAAPTSYPVTLAPDAVPYGDGVVVTDGIDDIVTEVVATRRATATSVVATSAAGKARYGTLSTSLDNLANAASSGAQTTASNLVARHSVERPKVEGLVLYPRRGDTPWATVLALRTGQGFRFKMTAGYSLDWLCSVLAVTHDADWSTANWVTTLSLLWEQDAP